MGIREYPCPSPLTRGAETMAKLDVKKFKVSVACVLCKGDAAVIFGEGEGGCHPVLFGAYSVNRKRCVLRYLGIWTVLICFSF